MAGEHSAEPPVLDKIRREYGGVERWFFYLRQMGVETLSDIERQYFVGLLRLVRNLDDAGIRLQLKWVAKQMAAEDEREAHRQAEQARQRNFMARVVMIASVASAVAALIGIFLGFHFFSPR